MAATLLTTCLMVVMQLSGYSIFHDRDTPSQLSLPWQSHTSVSVSILKPLLKVIGVILLKPQASPIA